MIFKTIQRLGLANILHWKLVAASPIDGADGCNALLTLLKRCASNVVSNFIACRVRPVWTHAIKYPRFMLIVNIARIICSCHLVYLLYPLLVIDRQSRAPFSV